MRLLDLFCGEGGASAGYVRAGFEVVGVDLFPMKRYPYEFVLGDALTVGAELLRSGRFAAVHASPPCQNYSALKHLSNGSHPALIEPVRALFQQSGVLWVIENVPGAPLIDPIVLCGTQFGLHVRDRWLKRHRLFESSVALVEPVAPHRCRGHGLLIGGVYGGGGRKERARTWRGGGYQLGAADKRLIMEMPWATRDGCSQAIPPAYTEFLGKQLMSEAA